MRDWERMNWVISGVAGKDTTAGVVHTRFVVEARLMESCFISVTFSMNRA